MFIYVDGYAIPRLVASPAAIAAHDAFTASAVALLELCDRIDSAARICR